VRSGTVEHPEEHRVVVVDDDERLLALAWLALQKHGIRVSTASTPDAHARSADTPDLVILDIVLSTMSGWELLRQIRETDDCLVMLVSGRDSVTRWPPSSKTLACVGTCADTWDERNYRRSGHGSRNRHQ